MQPDAIFHLPGGLAGCVDGSRALRVALIVATPGARVPQALLAAGPAHRVKLESACAQDLRLRLGPDEITTMPAESFARLALPDGTSVAIVDADGHEVASWVSAAGQKRVRIASSCQAIVPL